MTIAGSLSNALSGLTASSRAAELISSNVANSMTEGYGRREIELSTRYVGGGVGAGVNVVGVRREVDLVIVQDRRLADATAGRDAKLASFHENLQKILGTPDQEGSLSGRLDRFEAALIEAASRPDNEARLASLRDSVTALVSHINTASDRVQDLRMRADAEIESHVMRLNDGLQRVQNLNYEIQDAKARGQDLSTLMDLRQQEIDAIAEIMPLRQVARDRDGVALFTPTGAILLDGRAANVGFSKVGVIVPEMTQDTGALSGLAINGNPVRTDGERSPIQGGTLGALFEVRDGLATGAQERLDAVARDLVERFQDPSVDPTRAAGAPGLFTDAGSPFDPTDELGLSARLSVNTLIDPQKGGELWRLRDGLGAVAPGEAGDSRLLQALNAALTDERVSASGDFLGVARSASGLAADFLSIVGADRNHAEARQSYSASQQYSLKAMELENGVDTDHELQKLMLIEQAYSANAKVITTVEQMIDILIGL